MAKSKKTNPNQQPLSPENYIKTRARLLPLHECLVNTTWQEDGIANLIISRKHSNGNVTMCIYSVDLHCVGVKDTFFNFNIEYSRYDEMKRTNSKNLKLQTIDYVLAHNIIFAGVEYAETLGIEPHKDFQKITQYFLEENSIEIEYMEIECGLDGKPFFLATDFYTPAQSNAIIKQLEKSVGKGNFDFIKEVPSGTIFEEDDFEEIEDEKYRYFNQLQPMERADLFKKMINKLDDNDKNDTFENLIKLANAIYVLDLCDMRVVDTYLEIWNKNFKYPIGVEYIFESINKKAGEEFDEELLELIDLATEAVSSESNVVDKDLQKLLKKHTDNPYFCYINLQLIAKEENEKKYTKQLEKYVSTFPSYPLLKMEKYRNQLKQTVTVTEFDILPHKIFEMRTGVSPFEMYQYLLLKMSVECKPHSFNVLQALEDWSLSLPIDESHKDGYIFLLQLLKIDFLQMHFKIND